MTVIAKPNVAAEIERALTALFRGPRIRRLHESLNRRAGVDLDRPSYIALATLDDGGPMRVSELADACAVDNSTMSRLIDRLMTAGWLEREQAAADKRVVLVRLNDAGQAVLGKLKGVRRKALAEILGAWSASEQEAFAELLARFVEDSEALVQEPEA